jgi:hypothetical protein
VEREANNQTSNAFFWQFGLQGSFINRDIYDDARSAQSILAIDDDD